MAKGASVREGRKAHLQLQSVGDRASFRTVDAGGCVVELVGGRIGAVGNVGGLAWIGAEMRADPLDESRGALVV